MITNLTYIPSPLQCKIKYITSISFLSIILTIWVNKATVKKTEIILTSMKKNMRDTQELIILLYEVAVRPQVSTAPVFAHYT